MSNKTTGSRIAESLRAFADCKHEHWKCEKCGCRTNGPGVDSLCNGNAAHKLNQPIDEPPEVAAAVHIAELPCVSHSQLEERNRVNSIIARHYLKIRRATK